MPADKSKQLSCWWVNDDIEIQCMCGNYIQNCRISNDGTPYYVTCLNCGQRWQINLIINPVDDAVESE